MVRNLVCGLVIVAVAFLVGCQTHRHVIGDGAQEWRSMSERQWYAVWGLIPINEVDTQELAEGITDYEIKTETTFLDGLMNIVTGLVTISSRTVTITK